MGSLGSRRRSRPARRDDDAAPDTGPSADDPPADPESAARTLCLGLLTTRARSRSELADELGRRGIDEDVSGRVLDRLAEVGLVDDAAFAEQWVASRHRHRGLGRRALADELHRKGIDRGTATTALAGLDRDDEHERARALVERRLPSTDRLEHAVAARRLVGMLARKGYPAGLAHEVVREALAERADASDDPEAMEAMAGVDDSWSGG
jgi:regulatory protein